MSWVEYLVAGQGGQGVIELGNYIAHEAILRGLQAAAMPAYGPETRGGKVRCYVIATDQGIDYPVAENPDILVVMNNLSMDFEVDLKPGGLLLLNSNTVQREPTRPDITVLKIAATDLASQVRMNASVTGLTDKRVLTNAVLFGALLGLQHLRPSAEVLETVFQRALGKSKQALATVNAKAALQGLEFMTQRRSESNKGSLVAE